MKKLYITTFCVFAIALFILINKYKQYRFTVEKHQYVIQNVDINSIFRDNTVEDIYPTKKLQLSIMQDPLMKKDNKIRSNKKITNKEDNIELHWTKNKKERITDYSVIGLDKTNTNIVDYNGKIVFMNITNTKSVNDSKGLNQEHPFNNIRGLYKKYSVISVTAPEVHSLEYYNYAFIIPLTILAWKRIGFQTIVIISGSEHYWENDACLKIIFNYIKELKCLYLFLDVSDDQKIMVSQVSRIFIASLLSNQLENEDYVITSDADIWPLDMSSYVLKQEKDILVLNSECCGTFPFNGTVYRMIPMANVGAHVKTWKEILVARNQSLVSGANEMLSYLRKEFGELVEKKVVKGENEGWYMDQHLLSILIDAWFKRHDITKVDFVPRNVGRDRIDRAWWSTKTLEGKIDVHTLHHMSRTETWLKVLPLLRLMFGDNEQSSLYSLCLLYYEDFNNALKERSHFHK